jgi:hypothetical protein
MERDHPKDVGDRTTLAVMLALRMAGLAVLVPFGENTRYDLVVDDGNSLRRVQCKTGRLRHGAVRFAVCSTYGHHRNPQTARRPYVGQVDYFAVYCPETQSVYLVPIDDLPVKVQAALRVDSARNNQTRYVRRAADYRIASLAAEAQQLSDPL